MRVEGFDPHERDRVLDEFARSQHAVVSAGQLVAAGFAPTTAPARAGAHRLHRVHFGVYSLVPPKLLTAAGHRMAAVLACGPGAALSHGSAAAQHGLTRDGPSRIDVTVPTRGGRGRPGIRIHRSSTMRPFDVTHVDGIPCTTVARTCLDLSELWALRRVERLLDEAVVLEVFDLSALDEQIAHNGARRRASRTLRRALTEHRPGTTATDGPIGERMLAIIRATPGLPAPEVQRWLDLGDGEPMIQPDFLWREAKVILETDGGIHRRGRRVAADVRRDQRAARAGWHTLRVTLAQIKAEPARLSATLLAVVTSRSGSTGGSEAA